MLKVVIILLVSFSGFNSWAGPAKSRKSKVGEAARVKRSSKKSLIPKKISSSLTKKLKVNSELRLETQKALQKMVDKLHKSGPRLLTQKEAIFIESKQILQALETAKKSKDLDVLVSLVSKQSLSMISGSSKRQVENFHFLLKTINAKLVSSNVDLSRVLKKSAQEYVVARKKVSEAKKEAEGNKFLEALKKRCGA
ncbi:MAG: hypothetical protein HAW63_01160 [Bdellovibrionaceae bacterium]|nr:hypothetical protein [Pseudobdellovibrionaceae bacterium]